MENVKNIKKRLTIQNTHTYTHARINPPTHRLIHPLPRTHRHTHTTKYAGWLDNTRTNKGKTITHYVVYCTILSDLNFNAFTCLDI